MHLFPTSNADISYQHCQPYSCHFHFPIQTPMRSTPSVTQPGSGNPPGLDSLMTAIIAQNQRETGDNEIDTARIVAKATLQNYLNLPVHTDDPDINFKADTFKFWKDYSVTTDKAQKHLAHLARQYLTPPPTSCCVER